MKAKIYGVLIFISVLLMAISGRSQSSETTAKRDSMLRANAYKFRGIVPNTSFSQVVFRSIHFEESKLEMDRLYYNAIRFVLPPQGGKLYWGMVINTYLYGWYILPVEKDDNFTGFKYFTTDIVKKPTIPGLNKGDELYLQTLDSEYLIPGKTYIIFLMFRGKYPTDLVLSVNILDPKFDLKSVFKGIEPYSK